VLHIHPFRVVDLMSFTSLTQFKKVEAYPALYYPLLHLVYSSSILSSSLNH
jgi:hypothetical protein